LEGYGGPAVVVAVSTDPDGSTIREWDRLVDSTPGSDVAQLSGWATIRRRAGFRPLYLLAHQDGRLVGGALVLERRLPVIGRIGYVSNGPVVSPAVPRGPVVERVCAEMGRLARTRLRALFVQPPVDAADVSSGLLREGFRHGESGIAPIASIRIDLHRDVESLRRGLTRSNRRRTRTWAERGVDVRVGSREDVPLVAELLAQTAAHQDFEPLSLDYIQTLHRELDAGRHTAVFVAELDGTPVAALLCTLCGGVVKQRLTGMDRSERARREGVAAATVWHAMMWAKDNHHRFYDFGGISATAAQILLSGEKAAATRLTGPELFKASFGGEAFRYPQPVESIPSPLLRVAYDVVRRTRAGTRFVGLVKRALRGGRTLRAAAR
jgi:lipid II:glycine glycyltransferase (peptidoglycan interpeptide bridge formation enzyme)